MGVLGEARPDVITERLRRAARPYRASGRRVQIAYELIVTIADRHAGPDGDYSHAIPRSSTTKTSTSSGRAVFSGSGHASSSSATSRLLSNGGRHVRIARRPSNLLDASNPVGKADRMQHLILVCPDAPAGAH